MIAPMALVRLWQERWGIAQRFAPTREYTAIFINAWVQRHAVGNTTSYGGPLNLLLGVIGSVLLLLTVTTDYSVKGQLIFAGICIVISLLLRRLAGRLAFLMVAGLAMLAGLRYLTWRLQFTLTDDYYGIPSMLLWDAELFLIVAFGLQMVQTAFPFLLDRAPRLPASDKDPYIDVVLIAHQETLLSVSQVRGWIHEFRQQDWPADRLRFFVACSDLRHREVITQAGATLIVHGGSVSEKLTDGFYVGLPKSNGEFVAIMFTDHVSSLHGDPRVLRNWVEWMDRDPKLAVLHTMDHRYMPPDGPTVRKNMEPGDGEELAMVRRLWWSKVEPGRPFAAKSLEDTGGTVATVGKSVLDNPNAQVGPSWTRVETSVPEQALRARERLHRLNEIMQGGKPYAWFIVLTNLLLVGLLGIFPINSHLSSYLAFLLPLVALGLIANNRSQGPLHRGLWGEIRLIFLALILPPLVTLTMARSATRSVLNDAYPQLQAFRASHLLMAIGVGFCFFATLIRLPMVEGPFRPWMWLSLLGSVSLLMLTIADWAVYNERGRLADGLNGIERQPAAIRTAGGHLLRARAMNFPKLPLRLALRDPADSAALEGRVQVLFPNAHEAAFHGTLLPDDSGRIVEFTPEPEDISAFRNLQYAQRWEAIRRPVWLPPPRLGQWFLQLMGLRFLADPLSRPDDSQSSRATS